MKEFKDLATFTAHLEKCVMQYEPLKKVALNLVGQNIEDAAKRKLGVYQAADGPYEAWAPLAEATKQDRVRKGFSPDDPLYRTGDLMDSITHKNEPDTVTIGSDSDIAIYQELGTEDIPPRPFLGPAMYQERDHIKGVADELLLSLVTGNPAKFKKF